MQHDIILKREDGTRIHIAVKIHTSNIVDDEAHYQIKIGICAPKKRKFNYGVIWLDVVTETEIYAAKLEAWHSIKPKR